MSTNSYKVLWHVKIHFPIYVSNFVMPTTKCVLITEVVSTISAMSQNIRNIRLLLFTEVLSTDCRKRSIIVFDLMMLCGSQSEQSSFYYHQTFYFWSRVMNYMCSTIITPEIFHKMTLLYLHTVYIFSEAKKNTTLTKQLQNNTK